MYVVQNTQSNTDKIVAALVTSFLLVGMILALKWTSLPEVRQKTETYEEIDWAKFKPKPEKIVEQPKPEPIKTETPKVIESLPQPAPKPAAQKIDLSALQNMQLADLSKPETSLKRETPAETATNDLKVDLNKSSLAGLNTLLGESSTKLDMPKSGNRGRTKSNAPAIKAKSGKSVEMASGLAAAGGDLTLGAPESKNAAGGTAAQVPMMSMADLGGDFSDLSPIYHELIAWMRQHPANLPTVVSRFMEKKPGDLTSVVEFQIGGRTFEMFLLCKEKLYEVRICLLEGKQSTYLIDRGLKENTSFLRIGSVNLAPTGKVLSFGTVRTAASDQLTHEFYQIFFSWWESVGS